MSELTAAQESVVVTALSYKHTGAPIPAHVVAELDEIAAPWPGRWLLPWEDDEPERVIELCAGPGGWGEGLRTVLGLTRFDVVGVDINEDACATAAKDLAYSCGVARCSGAATNRSNERA
ncbi:hypothetical protein [Streptomyces sp. Je 1-332]|uniref:hypothetical protein n=1 Tax=Streptomyces sp. Je 1-332 TaxID=3231270 RepID=UPI0034575C56